MFNKTKAADEDSSTREEIKYSWLTDRIADAEKTLDYLRSQVSVTQREYDELRRDLKTLRAEYSELHHKVREETK